MAKYMMMWEVNESLNPVDPRERGEQVVKLVELTRDAIQKGKTTDWGTFLGGNGGYTIASGSALEVYQELQKFSPYIRFKVQEVLSLDDLEKTFRAMMG